MKGLELARRYWDEVGRPAFEKDCPEALERGAVGLVGEGSECFGFDDEISRDHDWGPGFCLWLTAEDAAAFGQRAAAVYQALPAEFLGFQRLRVSPETAHRVGVQTIPGFYTRYTGFDHPPQTLREWRLSPEHGLAVVTNGQVFQDPLGPFSAFRQALLAGYPEQLRRKKLAAVCALAAQSGQYNFTRCLKRGESVAALSALAEFITHIQRAIFLLNRRFTPYYKWTHRALGQLPILGAAAAEILRRLAEEPARRAADIEALSALVIAELHRQGLSAGPSDFLLDQAVEIQQGISDPQLAGLHLMAE